MIRRDPPATFGDVVDTSLANLRASTYQLQPKNVFIIDINGTEEELLAAMKQKTRYNISLAKKRGVRVYSTIEVSDIEPFWQ